MYTSTQNIENMKSLKSIYIIALFLLVSLISGSLDAQVCTPNNAVGGLVFVDYNMNGFNDETLISVPAITATAYDAVGNILDQTTVSPSGHYILAVPNGIRAKIEFTNLPAGYSETFHGASNHTNVQFATSPNCMIDYGVTIAEFSCDDAPPIMVPCYVNGDPSNPSTASRDALVMFDYAQRGNGANYATIPPTAGSGGMPTPLATAGEVGALWAVTYDQRSNTGFSSAVLKRFSGFGPMGIGGIYSVTNPGPSAVISQYLDLGTCLSIPAMARPDLAGSATTASYDVVAHQNAAKQGIGGMTTSSDGLFLYVIDLTHRQLVQIKLRNTSTGPMLAPSCANIQTYAIPGIASCNPADSRPWGVKAYQGKVYVGVVCSAESTQNAANMTVQVAVFNPSTTMWTNMFATPPSLNYNTKGCAAGIDGEGICCSWNPWLPANDYRFNGVNPEGFICYPQPLLSDIEFDADGSMVLGFMDRFGLMVGWQNGYDPSQRKLFSGMAGGDILYAYNDKVNNAYVLSTGANILDANGNIIKTGCSRGGDYGTEFYCADNVAGNHFEGFHGGSAFHYQTNQLLGTFVDAGLALGSGQVNAGGITYVRNQNGSPADYYSVYYNGGPETFGKAVGLGDIVAMCDLPPIEIGNFVWEDKNKNGIQDPNELPIPNVNVDLYNASGTVIASTTTDTDGRYYFNSNTTSVIMPFSTYYVVVRDYTLSGGLGVMGFFSTIANAGSSDINDTDGLTDGASGIGAIGNRPYIRVNTLDHGINNHNYDFGFASDQCEITEVIAVITECNKDDNPATYDIQVTFSWYNADAGDNIQVTLGSQTKNYTATGLFGTATMIFSVPPNQSNIPVTVTNTSKANCSGATTISTLSNNISISSVNVSSCNFDPESLTSTVNVTVNVAWNALISTDVVRVTVRGASQTHTVGTASGTQTFIFIVPADNLTNNSVLMELVDKCQSAESQFNTPPPCPGCVLKINKAMPLNCVFNTGVSTTDLEVEVYWYTPTVPANINVTANGQTLTVNATTNTGSSIVTFNNVPANGSTANPITAVFSATPSCSDASTYDAALPCTERRDLDLTKTVNTAITALGQNVTWTVTVTHRGDFPATGITVRDVLGPGLTYTGVHSASQGAYDGTTWNIGSMNTGQAVTLTLQSTVTQMGVFYNDAEICTMNESDIDSTPCNDVPTEDDYDFDCVSVPMPLCAGESYTINAKTGYFNYRWFRNGTAIPGTDGMVSFVVTEAGQYTYSATLNPAGGLEGTTCCPVIIEAATCPCSVAINDVDMVACVSDQNTTTTVVRVCANWVGTGANSTISILAVGSLSGSQTLQLTNQLTLGNGCIDFVMRVGETATFTASSGSCTPDTESVTVAPYCAACDIQITNVGTPSPCNYNAGTNTSQFSYTVAVSWTGLVVGQDIRLIASGSDILYAVPSGNGSHTFNVTGVATGSNQSIVAFLSTDPTCTATSTLQSPLPCTPVQCNMILEVTPGICQNNAVDLVISVSWTGAAVGDILTVNAGGATFNSPPLTAANAASGGASFTVNVPAPASGNVTASMPGSGCNQSRPYSAPGCPACGLTITSLTINDCVYNPVLDREEFTAEVCVQWENAFGGDIINFELGDNVVIQEQQAAHYVLQNTSGQICVTLKALSDGTQNRDMWVYFNVTSCSQRQTDVIDSPACCDISSISIQSLECLDNNTPSIITDNRIRVGIMAINSNTTLTNYNVTVNGGTTVTPPTGTYDIGQYFVLGSGTAGGGASFILTLTDSQNAGCTETITVNDPGNCAPAQPLCEPVKCGNATIQVNGN